jgi:hypothetical protein
MDYIQLVEMKAKGKKSEKKLQCATLAVPWVGNKPAQTHSNHKYKRPSTPFLPNFRSFLLKIVRPATHARNIVYAYD